MEFNINATIHVHHHGNVAEVVCKLDKLLAQGESIMATQAQLVQDLNALTAQIAKIGVETGKTLQQVIDLQALIAAGGNTTPEVDAALAALKTQAQATDDLIPDAPTP